jgi:hypothetical protein
MDKENISQFLDSLRELCEKHQVCLQAITLHHAMSGHFGDPTLIIKPIQNNLLNHMINELMWNLVEFT